MTDTGRTFQSPGDDTSPKLVLNEQLFRSRTQALGARTDVERCTIAGISKASLHRWRHGSVTPSYTLLLQMARRLNVSVVELTVEVKR